MKGDCLEIVTENKLIENGDGDGDGDLNWVRAVRRGKLKLLIVEKNNL